MMDLTGRLRRVRRHVAVVAGLFILVGGMAGYAQSPADTSAPAPIPSQVDSILTPSDSTVTPLDSTAASASSVQEAKYKLSEVKFFTVDNAIFRYDDQHDQLEIYSLIDRGFLKTEPRENGLQGRYQITFKVIRDDSVLIGDSWERSDFSPDSTTRKAGQKIPELIKYVIAPGQYRIAVRVVDLIGNSYYDEEYPITVHTFPSNKVAVSEIMLASRIEPAKGDVGEFDHNGLLVLPNAERMYGATNPLVYYYTEIYNLTTGDSSTYRVNRRVLNDRHEVVKTLPVRERPVAASACADVDAFSIATLRSGSYFLQIKVTDDATGDTTETERNFWVYRPAERMVGGHLGNPGFDIAAMSDSSVDKELNEIKYLMSDRLRAQLKQVNTPAARRAFLAQFWIANDPDTTTIINENREEYMRRLKIANERYGSLKREGWTTDRGRVYLLNGEPSHIEDHPFDPSVGKAYQIWHYDKIEGGVIYVFVDRSNYGDYVQVHSTKRGELSNPDWYRMELRGF